MNHLKVFPGSFDLNYFGSTTGNDFGDVFVGVTLIRDFYFSKIFGNKICYKKPYPFY